MRNWPSALDKIRKLAEKLTRERYLSEGLELEPEMVELALRGLTITRPDVAVSLDTAVVLGKQGAPKGNQNAAKGKAGESKTNLAIQGLKYGSVEYWLARLDRDGKVELAAQVRSGKLSANAAAIQAGWRKKRKNLSAHDQAVRLLPKMTREEREDVMNKIREMNLFSAEGDNPKSGGRLQPLVQ